MRFLSSKVFFLMNIKKDIYFMNIYLNYLGIWLKNDAFHKKKKRRYFCQIQKMHKWGIKKYIFFSGC